jgi:hypothetical protein
MTEWARWRYPCHHIMQLFVAIMQEIAGNSVRHASKIAVFIIAQGESLSYATPDNRFEGSYWNTVSSIASSEAHQGHYRRGFAVRPFVVMSHDHERGWPCRAMPRGHNDSPV